MDYATKVVPGKFVEGYKILKKMNGFLKYIGLEILICPECFK